jgi:8-hydroxy-5-deazaflavin:NADPH oxidoreductase
MKYAIIGSGAIGTALASQFSRKKIEVSVANSRGPASLGELKDRLGRYVKPATMQEVSQAETAILAVPFGAVANVAKEFGTSHPSIVIYATNAISFPSFTPIDLGGRPSSEVVGETFTGSSVVKAFNTLPAKVLEAEPVEGKLRRVIFVSGDHSEACKVVSSLVEELDFFPLNLGKLAEGGRLQEFGGPLTLHNLLRKD